MAERFIVDSNGQKQQVVLDVAEYEGLLQRIEKLEDMLLVEKSRREGESFRPFEEFMHELEQERDVRASD